MASHNSNRGLWSPAKEDVYVDYSQSKFKANKGRKSHHYTGPDRAALDQLKEAGEDHFGIDVENDPQLLELAQRHNLKVTEYLEKFKPTPQQEADKKEANERVNDHSLPVGRKGVSPAGGGVTKRGAFAEEGEMPV